MIGRLLGVHTHTHTPVILSHKNSSVGSVDVCVCVMESVRWEQESTASQQIDPRRLNKYINR